MYKHTCVEQNSLKTELSSVHECNLSPQGLQVQRCAQACTATNMAGTLVLFDVDGTLTVPRKV